MFKKNPFIELNGNSLNCDVSFDTNDKTLVSQILNRSNIHYRMIKINSTCSIARTTKKNSAKLMRLYDAFYSMSDLGLME